MTDVKQEKPRGKCTGCDFEYQLGTARSGEYKGLEVIRKHNSRKGPGLCEGAQKPPAVEMGEVTGDEQAFADPEPAEKADRPHLFTAAYDSDGSCGHDIAEGDTIRADGEGGFLCAECSKGEPGCCEECRAVFGSVASAEVSEQPTAPAPDFADPAPVEVTERPLSVLPVTSPAPAPEFADPAPMPAEMQSVNGQPEEDRDKWGRYRILGVSHTRTTTFVKMGSSTFALGEWNERMLIKGLVERPDLLAMAHGLDVKRDKQRLNAIADDAQKHAGNKIAANIGTALHTFTERLDAGVGTLDDVPPQWRGRCAEYGAKLAEYGLTTRRDWIERTTAVRADQVSAPVPVAGKLDRIFQLPNGDLVIGDLKGLALTERLPTPDGWTTMGDVVVGDMVFDAYGVPCKVTAKSDVKRIGTYRVRFDDGSEVVCDTEHIWWTSDGTRPGAPTAKPIAQIISTLTSRWNQKQHRVPVAGPLELPTVGLPVDPYLLGCWLGDGSARGGQITKGHDLFEILSADGHDLGVVQLCKSNACVTRTVKGLVSGLREAGVLNNKHIPTQYLRSSVDQRIALLRGLMDTDGTWNTARKTAVFYSVDKELAKAVEELLLSLGQRPHLAEVPTHGFGKDVIAYHVAFTPVDLNPFRLPRKADQAEASDKPVTRSRRRVIVSVDPGPDVETACIAVDSPTRTYLCGDRMIPTHNTGSDLSYGWSEIAAQLAVYAHGVNTHGLFDWNTKQWQVLDTPVRTDYAIVMHLPADGEGCHLYRVDLVKGWEFAQVSGRVQARQKDKSVAAALTVLDVQTPPVAVGTSDHLPDTPRGMSQPIMGKALEVINATVARAELAPVYEYAVTSGKFTEYQLDVVKRWCARRWGELPA